MEAQKDSRDLLELLNAHKIEYTVHKFNCWGKIKSNTKENVYRK